MFFDDNSIEKIKEQIATDENAKKGWLKLVKSCEEIDDQSIDIAEQKIAEYAKRAEEFGGAKHFTLGNHIRILSQQTIKLSFLYLIENNEAILDRVKRLICMICGVKAWVFQGRLNGWDSDLWTADIGVHISISYEIIKPSFSDCEKSYIEDALYKKSFLPLYQDWVDCEKRIHALDSMGHNWWSVCVSGAGIVALVIKNTIPKFENCLSGIVDGLGEWFSYSGNVLQNKKGNFGIDGDFIEFAGYLDYALSNFAVFEDYYRREFQDDRFLKIPFYKNMADYYLITCQYIKNKGYKTINYGDVSSTTRTSLFLDFVPLYFVKICKNKTLLKIYPDLIGDLTSPYSFYFYPNMVSDFIESIPNEMVVFEHSGYLFLRDNKTSSLFTMKAGESWNHNHLDVGSFMISYNGTEFVVDSGTCTYTKPEYNTYYKTPQAHNVILFNGQGQCSDMLYCGTKFNGTFPVSLSAENYKYVLCDCTGPYANIYQRFYRHIVSIDHVILLIDDVFTYEKGDLEWLLHYEGIGEFKDDKFDITIDDTMSIYPICPNDIKIVLKDGFKQEVKSHVTEDGYLPQSKYLSVQTKTDDDRRKKFINLFSFPNNDMTIEKCGTELISEIIMKNQEKTSRIICNFNADGRVMHSNSHIDYKNIKTDAFLVCIQEDNKGNVTRVCVHNGSYLNYNDKLYFSRLVKSDIVLDIENC